MLSLPFNLKFKQEGNNDIPLANVKGSRSRHFLMFNDSDNCFPPQGSATNIDGFRSLHARRYSQTEAMLQRDQRKSTRNVQVRSGLF